MFGTYRTLYTILEKNLVVFNFNAYRIKGVFVYCFD